jgi:hypothetical protein
VLGFALVLPMVAAGFDADQREVLATVKPPVMPEAAYRGRLG